MRAFLAVDPDESLRRRLEELQNSVRKLIAGQTAERVRITWVRPRVIHLTLAFLGDVDESIAAPLQDAVSTIVKGARAVAIPLDRVGVFPRVREPRVIWLGPSSGWEKGDEARRLTGVVRQIGTACAEAGVTRDEQPWSPHLTLGRVRAGERSVGQALAESGLLEKDVDTGILSVTEVSLMKSELLPAGPVHTKLWTVPFR